MRASTPRTSSDRLVNSVSRATINKASDDHLLQQVDIAGFAGETQANIENPHEYGFASQVQPPTQSDGKSAESFVAFAGANRSHGVALVTPDRRYRLMNMQPGEVALHDDLGQQVHLTRKGIVQTGLNSQKHVHQIMPDKASALNKDQQSQSGATGQPTSQYGQTPWQTLIDKGKQAPFAYHGIDKDTRTTQHPGTIQHQVIDPKDAADPTIPSSKKKVIHSRTADQKKGVIDSVASGKHMRTIDPDKGITDSVANGDHSITIDPSTGITEKTKQQHNRQADGGITDTASTIAHKGNTNVTGTLGVSGLASFAKGLGTGALEVASDADGGLVQATMGLAVTLGLTTDEMTFSALPPNFANDAAAASGGVPLMGVYRNGSILMVRVA